MMMSIPDKNKWQLVHVPAFAQFILNGRLDEFVAIQLDFARKIEPPPILRFMHHLPEKELEQLMLEKARHLLTQLAANNMKEAIAREMEGWKNNRFKYVEQDQLELDDLFFISRIRKKALREMLKKYTSDLSLTYALIEEMDHCFSLSGAVCANTYLQLWKGRTEDLLLEAQEIANMGSYIWSLNGGKTYKSPQVSKILGLEESESFESFRHSKIHASDRQNVLAAIDKAITETGELEIEYRCQVNEEERIIWEKGRIIFENGQPVSMRGMLMDVTDKHHMTRKLERSEELYKQAQALNKIGNWNWEIASDKLYWSDELYRIYGLEPQAGKLDFNRYIAFVHPSDRMQRIEELQRQLADHGWKEYYFRIQAADGKEKVLYGQSQVLVNEEGVPYKMIGTCQDVTEKQTLIRNLQESEALYKQAQALAHIGNWTFDLLTNKLSCSDELYRIYETEPEEMTAELILRFLHRNADEERGALPPLLEKEETYEAYYTIQVKSGTTKTLHIRAEVLRDESGMPLRLSGTTQDVTRQKELENSLYLKTKQLERSNASLQEFAYISSHDLKEPLRKIAVFSDRLRATNASVLSEESMYNIDKIIYSARKMQQMVDDILALSRVTADYSFRKVSLNDLLGDVLNTLDLKIEECKAVIEAGKLPDVYVNEVQFRQVLLNLLSNSLKFRKTGVPPLIRIRHQYLKKEEVGKLGLEASESRYLKIELADNGIGFDNKYVQKIFTVFQRLHNGSHYEGTGIGLAICKKVVEHHHGIMMASGEPGQGAVFTIIIPVVQPSKATDVQAIHTAQD